MADLNKLVLEPLVQFANDGQNFARKCKKPDRKGEFMRSFHTQVKMLFVCIEFLVIARTIGVGFLIVGFIGFLIKLVHIPINNILVGGI